MKLPVPHLTIITILLVMLAAPAFRASAQAYPGYTLYGPNNTKKTYLIDMSNTRVHTWTSSRTGGYAVYLLEDGSIMRTCMASNPQIMGGGGQGVVQRVAWDGTLLWEYTYSGSTYLAHHDVCVMPNGNVLMIAWEVKSAAQCVAAGLDHSASIWPDHIIEVQPTGSSGGNIVWKWHAWDHLIQDYSASKANYGVVGNHPELLDINAGNVNSGDWMHLNSIDYNPELDQIIVSSHNLNEVYVIDHSTTTAQAASHSGGNSGKGGDFLYRWGQPANYRAPGSAYFDVVHCGSWIPAGLPGAGHILAFNNRAKSSTSIIAEITPPSNSSGQYSYTSGQAYAPTAPTWTYTASGFFSNHLGGVQRLPNGNTLIAQSTSGKMLEVTSSGSVVWNYAPGGEIVRAYRYGVNYPGILLSSTPTVSKVEISTPTTSAWPTISIPFRVTCNDTVRYALDKSYFTVLEDGSPVGNFNISCPGSGTGMCTLSYASSCPDGTQRSLSIRFSGYCTLDTTVVQNFSVPRDTAAFTPVHVALSDAAVQDADEATVTLSLLDAFSNHTFSASTFEVQFDRSLVDFTSISTPAGSLLSGVTINTTPTVEGMLFTLPSPYIINGSGSLAELVFSRVAAGAVVRADLILKKWTFTSGCFKALHAGGSATFERTQRLTVSLPDSSTIDFGEVLLGAQSTRSFIANSTGGHALRLEALSITGGSAGEFSSTATGFPRTLAHGTSDTIILKYSPAIAGLAQATALLQSDDPTRPMFTVFLKGTGLLHARRPEIACSVADSGLLDFGTVNQNSSANRVLVVRNDGDSTLHITASTLAGTNASDFAITRGSGPHTLAPGQSDTLTLTFTWFATGSRNAMLTIASDDPQHAGYRVRLKGNGAAVDNLIATSTTTLDFGTVTLGRDTALAVRFVNSGRLASSIVGQQLSGSDSAEFAQIRQCASPLQVAAADSVIIKFRPTSTGLKSAAFSLNYGAASGTQTLAIALRGNCVEALRPVLEADTDTLRFDTTTVPLQATSSLLITNKGNAPLDVQSQSISGAQASVFRSATSLPHTVLPGDTVRLVYTFDPVVQGGASATLVLMSNDALSQNKTIILLAHARAAATPQMTVAAQVVYFDTLVVGGGKDTTVMIRNVGASNLLLSSQSILGTDASEFSVTSQAAATILPADSSKVMLRFEPMSIGSKTAILRVVSNDPAFPTMDISLSGIGVTTSAVTEAAVPAGVMLDQNYPNPFGPGSASGSGSTSIRYRITGRAHITLAVRDVFGRLIAMLADGYQDEGEYNLRFDASALPSGTYFYHLTGNGSIRTRSFLLLR